jgi:hypothetical protein
MFKAAPRLSRLSQNELADALGAGGRLVYFEFCISLVVFSLRRPSPVILLRPGERPWLRGLPCSLVSLLLGWWGIPWGIIYTPLTLLTNFTGGCDVTEQVKAALLKDQASARGLQLDT